MRQGSQLTFIVEPKWFAKKGCRAYIVAQARALSLDFDITPIGNDYIYSSDAKHFSVILEGTTEDILYFQDRLGKIEKLFRVKIIR